jgi:putative ABC transport system ATP-binding protein
MIRMRDVSREFRVGDATVHALDHVTLEIERGDFVALMGPSGSGKSTLLNVLGLLDVPTGGTYELDGEEVERLDDDRLADLRQRKIGFVFQSFHLVPRMTAARNVELPMIFAGIPPAHRHERVEEALRGVGLLARATHRPDQLSGGERQRVAIARAMVLEPKLLLADEPTGNLDSVSGREIVNLLTRMNAQGLTIVLVTHDPGVASFARHVIRMHDGRLLPEGDGGVGALGPGKVTPAGGAP